MQIVFKPQFSEILVVQIDSILLTGLAVCKYFVE